MTSRVPSTASPEAAADEVCRILAERYEDFADAPMPRCFTDIKLAHTGNYPGLLVCDMPYHDLSHALSTALLMAHLNGACLEHDHEQRSVDFVQVYLAKGAFADYAAQAGLIHATNFHLPNA